MCSVVGFSTGVLGGAILGEYAMRGERAFTSYKGSADGYVALLGRFCGGVAGGVLAYNSGSDFVVTAAKGLCGAVVGGAGSGVLGYYAVKDLLLKTNDPSLGIFTYGGGVLIGIIGAVAFSALAINL